MASEPVWRLFRSHSWEDACGTQWVQARAAAKHPTVPRPAAQQRVTWPQISRVLRLKILPIKGSAVLHLDGLPDVAGRA